MTNNRFSETSPFRVVQKFIAGDPERRVPGAVALRLVPPDEKEHRGGSDLQGCFETVTGSYWHTFCTFPEVAGKVRPAFPPLPREWQ